MKLNELKPARGAVRPRKRIGRGQGSGTGGTAGRGHKGHSSRSGGGNAPGFEGGQMPIQRRLPKGGFTNINRVEYQVVNVSSLSVFEAGSEVTPATLKERRLARKATIPVKLLGRVLLPGKIVKGHRSPTSKSVPTRPPRPVRRPRPSPAAVRAGPV